MGPDPTQPDPTQQQPAEQVQATGTKPTDAIAAVTQAITSGATKAAAAAGTSASDFKDIAAGVENLAVALTIIDPTLHPNQSGGKGGVPDPRAAAVRPGGN